MGRSQCFQGLRSSSSKGLKSLICAPLIIISLASLSACISPSDEPIKKLGGGGTGGGSDSDKFGKGTVQDKVSLPQALAAMSGIVHAKQVLDLIEDPANNDCFKLADRAGTASNEILTFELKQNNCNFKTLNKKNVFLSGVQVFEVQRSGSEITKVELLPEVGGVKSEINLVFFAPVSKRREVVVTHPTLKLERSSEGVDFVIVSNIDVEKSGTTISEHFESWELESSGTLDLSQHRRVKLLNNVSRVNSFTRTIVTSSAQSQYVAEFSASQSSDSDKEPVLLNDCGFPQGVFGSSFLAKLDGEKVADVQGLTLTTQNDQLKGQNPSVDATVKWSKCHGSRSYFAAIVQAYSILDEMQVQRKRSGRAQRDKNKDDDDDKDD